MPLLGCFKIYQRRVIKTSQFKLTLNRWITGIQCNLHPMDFNRMREDTEDKERQYHSLLEKPDLSGPGNAPKSKHRIRNSSRGRTKLHYQIQECNSLTSIDLPLSKPHFDQLISMKANFSGLFALISRHRLMNIANHVFRRLQ